MTPEEWINEQEEARQDALRELRQTFNDHLPEGFEERVSGGMLHWVVPKETYPDGYHCNPDDPLPFISLANRKRFIPMYHMGLYAEPDVLEWFQEAYPKHARTKLDMGKSCVRFKKMDDVPYDLLAELAQKFSVQDWIELYERAVKK